MKNLWATSLTGGVLAALISAGFMLFLDNEPALYSIVSGCLVGISTAIGLFAVFKKGFGKSGC
jgi:hypothetical protein